MRGRGSGPDRHANRNLALFCHGLPNYLALNYVGPGSNMRVYEGQITALPTDIFAPGGRIFSYACSTAMEGFGQALADHFGVAVSAFKRRTKYGSVIRDRRNHEAIAARMGHRRVMSPSFWSSRFRPPRTIRC